MGKIWTVCSGNGGTGKTTLALALAAGAAKAGKRVILLDASGLSRACDLILGLESIVVLDMMDVLREQAHVEAALYPVRRYENLRFACASLYDDVAAADLSSILLVLQTLCDILVVDLASGHINIPNGIMHSEDEYLLVLRPDDASVRASERLLARLADRSAAISLVINRSSRERLRHHIQYTRDSIQCLLDRPLIGWIPEDPSIPVCAKKGQCAIECDGPAWNALNALIKSLL